MEVLSVGCGPCEYDKREGSYVSGGCIELFMFCFMQYVAICIMQEEDSSYQANNYNLQLVANHDSKSNTYHSMTIPFTYIRST